MNSAEEQALAWALLDSARSFLRRSTRLWLCAQIGAGELHGAIRTLLEVCAQRGTALPADVNRSLECWVNGYAGSDLGPLLRELIDRALCQGHFSQCAGLSFQVPGDGPTTLVEMTASRASLPRSAGQGNRIQDICELSRLG